MKKSKLIVIGLSLLLVGISIGFYLAGSEVGPVTSVPKAEAAGGQVKSPTAIAPERYVYYPGTEKLAMDEIRVIASVWQWSLGEEKPVPGTALSGISDLIAFWKSLRKPGVPTRYVYT